MQIQNSIITLTTATGPMRCLQIMPLAAGGGSGNQSGKTFGAVLFYSEIFQITAPIARAAAIWRRMEPTRNEIAVQGLKNLHQFFGRKKK